MSSIQSGDKFLVNRSNNSYQLEAVNTMAEIQDNDLMLVNRSGTSYKISGADVKESLDPTEPPVLQNVALAEGAQTSGKRFDNQTFISTVTGTLGVPAATQLGIKATVDATIIDKLETSAITDVNPIEGGWNPESVVQLPWHKVGYGDGKYVALSYDRSEVMYSTDAINWTQTSAPTSGRWGDLRYGAGKFVAINTIGSSGVLIYSSDGINWSQASTGNAVNWRGMTYGGGKFVAVSNNTSVRAMYSTDGINWTLGEANNDTFWASVVYGNGKYVAVGSAGSLGNVMYSTDGINWTQVDVGPVSLASVTYGNGKFVAVSGDNEKRVRYSTDGVVWEEAVGIPESWDTITYGSGLFVAVALTGTLKTMYSSDGISWVAGDVVDNTNWRDITYGGGRFVAVGYNGDNRAMWSYTGGPPQEELTFTDDTDLSLLEPLDPVEQSNKNASGEVGEVDTSTNKMRLVSTAGSWSVGQTVVGPPRPLETSTITNVSSTSGTWNAIGTANGVPLSVYQTIAYGGGKFVALSSTGVPVQLIYSNDGINWTSGSISNENFYDLTYDGSMFVASAGGAVLRSTDGINWLKSTSGVVNSAWRGITYGNGKYVAVTNGGSQKAMYSTDAINWTNVSTSNDSYRWYGVTYGGGVFVAVGDLAGARAMYSFDGINWTTATVPADFKGTSFASGSVTYGDGKFVAVASSTYTGSDVRRVMHSYDGITWYSSAPVPTTSFRGVTYGAGLFVAVGNNTDNNSDTVIYSSDGITWYATNDGVPATTWTGVAYGADKFVAVANFGDNRVMTSTTGGGEAKTLTFTNNQKLSLFQPGDPVRQNDDAATGFVSSVNVGNRTMNVAITQGTWSANTNKYVIGPRTPSTENAQLFAKLDSELNVVDLQSTDPGFVYFTGLEATIQFPPVLANGEAPDQTLLDGSSIFTTVLANNFIPPASEKSSNVVTPLANFTSGTNYTPPQVTFNKNDPNDVVQFNAIKEAFEGYEDSKAAYRSDLKNRIIAAGLTEDEVRSLGL